MGNFLARRSVVSLKDWQSYRRLRRQLVSSYKNKVLAMTSAERGAEKQALAKHLKTGARDLVTLVRVELFLEVENG